MTRPLLVLLVATCCAAAWPRAAAAAEVAEDGEVFIDPMDVSGGFLSPLTPLSPRPQTQLHIVPVEFLLLNTNIPFVTDEHFLQYQIRAGGSVAFARRFEIGAELVPLHVLSGRYRVSFGPVDEQQDDSDVSFGNISAHFLGNILARHGEQPTYLSAAFRLTIPTASDVGLDLDGDGDADWEARVDAWILEPQLLFGITLGGKVTLSTRQGLAIFIAPGERQDDPLDNPPPFHGDNQVHWAMNLSAGVAPIKHLSIVADFTALFCMNEVRFWDPEERGDGVHPSTHPIFLYLGLGAKVYPIPALAIEAGFRFGLTDETQYTVGLFSFALKVSYEWDVSIGGVTVIKESTGGTGKPSKGKADGKPASAEGKDAT